MVYFNGTSFSSLIELVERDISNGSRSRGHRTEDATAIGGADGVGQTGLNVPEIDVLVTREIDSLLERSCDFTIWPVACGYLSGLLVNCGKIEDHCCQGLTLAGEVSQKFPRSRVRGDQLCLFGAR